VTDKIWPALDYSRAPYRSTTTPRSTSASSSGSFTGRCGIPGRGWGAV